MATKQANTRKANAAAKKANNFETAAKKILGFADTGYDAIQDITDRSDRLNRILTKNADIMQGIAGGSIIDFMQTLQSDPNTREAFGMGTSKSSNDKSSVLNKLKTSGNDVFTYFKELYSNHYIEMADLQFISKFIPALGEAVNVTNDSICATDDNSGSVNYTLEFDPSVDQETQNEVKAKFKSIAKEEKLLKKLKNVYRNATVSGAYMVYAISYSELFEQYDQDKDKSRRQFSPFGMGERTKDKSKNKTAVESVMSMNEYDIAQESVINTLSTDTVFSIANEGLNISNGDGYNSKEIDSYTSYLNSHLSKIVFEHTNVLSDVLPDISAMESVKGIESNDPSYVAQYTKYFGKTNIDTITGYPDTSGIKDINGSNSSSNYNISGTYTRYIPAKNLVPVKLMNELVGYYYITTEKKTNSSSSNGANAMPGAPNPMSNLSKGTGMYTAVNLSEDKRMKLVDSIIDSMSNAIIGKFNQKFVTKNSNFKRAIADCITYNGYLDNEYHVQFIEAKYIHEFKVNEDADGNGTSILINSLFPAKLLLSLMVSRVLNYINNSADRTIVYVNKGPIDVYAQNQTQRIARNLQESNITFADLLSTNLVFNKYGRNQKIVMPTAKDGTRLAEFETQEGMNIDMNPEYENKLLNMVIMGTSVPSVIMEYIGTTDYAKGFETGNIKYAKHISALQSDLEVPTTDLVQTFLMNSDLSNDVKSKIRNKVNFKLVRSKTLTMTNNSDFLGTFQNLFGIISQMYGGDGTDPITTQNKQNFVKLAARDYAPFIDWADMDAKWEQAQLMTDPNQVKKHENELSS